MSFLFAPPTQAVLALEDTPNVYFPVRRVFGIAANYGPVQGEKPAAKYFMKSPETIVSVAPKTEARLPFPENTADLRHEVELVACIGTFAKDLAPENALETVFGYACGLDMTRMDLRKADAPWEAAKTFPGASPVTPIREKHRMPDPVDLRLWLYVNNSLRQDGTTKGLIRSVPEVIAEISHLWPLEPGDVIFTGTPPGAAAIAPGDVITAGVEGIFTLKVTYGEKPCR